MPTWHELNRVYGLSLTRKEVLRGRKKWSTRIGSLFEARGKVWNPATERKVKCIVAGSVEQGRASALLEEGATAIAGVARRLEELLGHGRADIPDAEIGAEPEPHGDGTP